MLGMYRELYWVLSSSERRNLMGTWWLWGWHSPAAPTPTPTPSQPSPVTPVPSEAAAMSETRAQVGSLMAAVICSEVGKRCLSALWSSPNLDTCFHERQEKTIPLGPTFVPVRLGQM